MFSLDLGKFHLIQVMQFTSTQADMSKERVSDHFSGLWFLDVSGGFLSGPWSHTDLENSWLCSVIFTCSNGKYQGFIFQWFGVIFPMIFQYFQWFKNNLGVFLGGPKQMQVLLSLRSSDIEAETWHKRRAATFLGNHRHRSMVAICCYHCLNNSVLDISEENNGKYLKIGYIQINWV